MILECVLFKGVNEMAFTEDNVEGKQHIDILWDSLCNSALKLGNSDSYVQQNKDPKHTACIMRLNLLHNVKNGKCYHKLIQNLLVLILSQFGRVQHVAALF